MKNAGTESPLQLKNSLLCCSLGQSPCEICTEQGNISAVQQGRFLQCWTRGKGEKNQRILLPGKMRSHGPHPPLLLMLGGMRLLNPTLQKGFLRSYTG